MRYLMPLPLYGKSYVQKRFKYIADKYEINVTEVINLYNCWYDRDLLGEALVIEYLLKNHPLLDVPSLKEDIHNIWLRKEE